MHALSCLIYFYFYLHLGLVYTIPLLQFFCSVRDAFNEAFIIFGCLGEFIVSGLIWYGVVWYGGQDK
jgi:hypothetical protein